MRRPGLFVLLIGVTLLVAACSSAATAVPTATPTILPSPTVDAQLSPGQEFFISKGCAACHGRDAEGSSVAPALAGHTAEQVERQVRAPVGVMPLFPEDKVSEDELHEIIEFIEGLKGEHTHVPTTVTSDDLAMHHWMALFAIEAENFPEAIHHVDHTIGMTDGQHQAQMQEAMELLEEGNAHEAEHIIEVMIAGIESPGLDQPTMHLTMALSALRVDDTEGAAHHMQHFLDMAEPDQVAEGESILELVHQGMIHDAEHQLEDFMGHMDGPGDDGHHDMMDSEPHGGHP